MTIRMISSVVASFALMGAASAQDVGAAPAYGDSSLRAGFSPDPASVAVQAGGAIDASGLDSSCYGFITHMPSHNLSYRAGNYSLYISAASDADAIIVVNAPDGSWHCNDDAPGQGLNPGVEFTDPQSGLYNIWVGTLGFGGGYEPAMLHMSEIGYSSDNPFTRAPNSSLPPNAGVVSLRAGFTPDPRTMTVMAGGELDASRGTGDLCWGRISEAPDVWIDYAAASDGFDLYLSMEANVDSTMVVQGPDGGWYCDDDTAGDLNPGIRVIDAPAGRYAVWAGLYSNGPVSEATLFISELGFRGAVDTPAELDFSLPSNYGSVALEAGFAPDPHNVQLMAGGDMDVQEAIGGNCRAYATTAPDYDLTYEAGSFDLYISASSDSDATLIVNAPDGTWWCDDDSAGNLNPGVRFDAPQDGRYDIWVGTYSEGAPQDATLHISELGFGDALPSGSGLDISLPAINGDIALQGGFAPDPYTVDVIAGGPVAAETAVDYSCRGYVNEAPHVELSFEPGGLDLFISADANVDTTLVINDPNGNWVCNDDGAEGYNPGIHFEDPQAGVYDIYVGTYRSNNSGEARLSISELGFGQ